MVLNVYTLHDLHAFPADKNRFNFFFLLDRFYSEWKVGRVWRAVYLATFEWPENNVRIFFSQICLKDIKFMDLQKHAWKNESISNVYKTCQIRGIERCKWNFILIM